MMKMKRTEKKNMHNSMRPYLKFNQYSKVIPVYHQVVVQALTTVGL